MKIKNRKKMNLFEIIKKQFRAHPVFYLFFFAQLMINVPHSIPFNNELDVMMVAKHFVNPHWIPGDWYLGQKIAYRYLFNAIAGGICVLMPLSAAIITGRIIVTLMFSYIFEKFSLIFSIKYFVIFPFLIYLLKNQSMVSREWFIGGFETKAFAYFFVFLTMISIMKKKKNIPFLFGGLAFSFHILIGFYGIACVVLGYLITYRQDIKIPNISEMIKSSIISVVAGLPGLYSVFQYLFTSADSNRDLAAKIYVKYRVSHHVLPLAWNNHFWPILFAIALVIYLSILFKAENRKCKFLASIGIISQLFFMVGLVIFFLGKITLLRYYWFRFADIYIPLSLIILLAAFISNKVITGYKKNRLISKLKKAFLVLTLILCLLLLLLGTSNYMKFYEERSEKYTNISSEIFEAFDWISKNTNKESLFLVGPDMANYFYYMAERPVFVSFKHSPQNDDQIIEWYKRLRLCNGGDELSSQISAWENSQILERKFFSLSEKDIRRIVVEYNIDYFLDKKDKILEFKIVFENKEYRLYKIY